MPSTATAADAAPAADLRAQVRAAIEARGLSPYRAALAAGLPPDRLRAFLAGAGLRTSNLVSLLASLDLAIVRMPGREAQR